MIKNNYVEALEQIRAMLIPFTNNGHWLYRGNDLLPIVEYIDKVLGGEDICDVEEEKVKVEDNEKTYLLRFI